MHDLVQFFSETSWLRVLAFLVLGPLLFGNLASYLRRRYALDDGYSRKLHHVGIMVISGPLIAVLPDSQLMPSMLVATTALMTLSFVGAYGRRPWVRGIVEHSLRRRDEPHSRFFYLMPMVTSNVAIAVSSALYPLATVKVAFFTVALADGLAEPVGVRFGRSNTYHVPDPLWGRTNTKSLAGSSIVFLMSGLVALAMLMFLGVDLVAAIVLGSGYALITTMVEAVSPRGLDNMLIMLVSPLFFVVVGTAL